MPAHVYILTNLSGTVLYIGVTTQLIRRIQQHREPSGSDTFTRRYRVTRLVHIEEYLRVTDAIAREKQLKGWRRARKLALIRAVNPTFDDLLPSS